MATRKCSTCEQVKDVSEFPPVHTSYRSRPHCKECESKRVAEYYANNPDARAKKAQYMRDYRARTRRKKWI